MESCITAWTTQTAPFFHQKFKPQTKSDAQAKPTRSLFYLYRVFIIPIPISMAKSENSKPNSNIPPYVPSSAKVHPANDPEVDPSSYSLEKFRLYETRQVTVWLLGKCEKIVKFEGKTLNFLLLFCFYWMFGTGQINMVYESSVSFLNLHKGEFSFLFAG